MDFLGEGRFGWGENPEGIPGEWYGLRGEPARDPSSVPVPMGQGDSERIQALPALPAQAQGPERGGWFLQGHD